MRELWRKTVGIFWNYPVLWMPFVIADLCTVALTQLSAWAAHAILVSQTTSRSVLGGLAPVYNPAALHNAWMYSAPITAGNRFVNVCLLAVAFYLIGRKSQSIVLQQQSGMGTAFAELKSSPGRILWFSIKFCVCMLAGALIAILPTLSPLFMRAVPEQVFSALDWAFILAATLLIAWISVPMALKFLSYPGEGTFSPDVSLARKFAIIAATIWTAAGLAYNAIRPTIRVHSRLEGHVLGAVANVLIDVPLLLLFIALAIVSAGQEGSHEAAQVPEPEPLQTT